MILHWHSYSKINAVFYKVKPDNYQRGTLLHRVAWAKHRYFRQCNLQCVECDLICWRLIIWYLRRGQGEWEESCQGRRLGFGDRTQDWVLWPETLVTSGSERERHHQGDQRQGGDAGQPRDWGMEGGQDLYDSPRHWTLGQVTNTQETVTHHTWHWHVMCCDMTIRDMLVTQ